MQRIVKPLVTTGPVLFLFSLLLISYFVSEARPARLAGGAFAYAPSAETLACTGVQSKPKTSAIEDLYRTNCARCHGADGQGDTPLGQTYNSPNFTDNAWWQKHSDITSTGSLVSIIMKGKGGMPAFGKKLKTGEIKNLVTYVRKFRKAK
jgi:mono/diheme cytochrome c family protein